jgi:hypothetical protein
MSQKMATFTKFVIYLTTPSVKKNILVKDDKMGSAYSTQGVEKGINAGL